MLGGAGAEDRAASGLDHPKTIAERSTFRDKRRGVKECEGTAFQRSPGDEPISAQCTRAFLSGTSVPDGTFKLDMMRDSTSS